MIYRQKILDARHDISKCPLVKTTALLTSIIIAIML